MINAFGSGGGGKKTSFKPSVQPAPAPPPNPGVPRPAPAVVKTPVNNFSSVTFARSPDFILRVIAPIIPRRTVTYAPTSPLVSVSFERTTSSRFDKNALLDKFKSVNKKFSPYESLTGISAQRPEMLMVSEFKPIFNEDFNGSSYDPETGDYPDFVQGLNEHGDFVDVQMQVQNLYRYNIAKFLKKIKDSDEETKNQIEQRERDFFEAIGTTLNNVDYLHGLSQRVEEAKDSFNTKSDKFVISWETVIRTYYYDYFSWFTRYFGVSRNFIKLTPSGFLTKFGYQDQGVANFSSTKLYLQLLNEFRNITSNYSAKFLNQSIDRQKNDFKAVSINSDIYNAYYDVSKLAADIESPIYSDIARLNGVSIGPAVPRLSYFFSRIDKTFAFPKVEDKIAFFVHYLSREFRYSSTLANADNQAFLAQTYGYQVNNQGQNANFVDFMIGRVGSKITDVFANVNQNSLTAPAHILQGDNVILPFESKYLELDGSIYTPGSEYLFDSIFENASTPAPDGSPLNVANLERYSGLVNQVSNKFTEFVDRFRFFYMVPANTYTYWYRLSFNDRATVESPQLFVELIYDSLLDNKQVAKYDIANDPMSALLNLAYKDTTLKALLFMYVVISNSGNPATAVVNIEEVRRQLGLNSFDTLIIGKEQSALERIIEEIQTRINALVTTRFNYLYNDIFNIFGFYAFQFRPYYFDVFSEFYMRTPFGSGFNEITAENIADSLRRGSPALNFLKSTVANILNAFKNNGAFLNTRTRYSDINDSLVTALSFELCLTVFDNHINTRFLNRFFTRDFSSVGREYYTISNEQSNTGASVSLVTTKISDEVDLQIQCITGLTAILRRIVDSSIATLNIARNEETVRVLNNVIATLGSRKYLSHLMSEQQLILAKSLADDVKIKLFANAKPSDFQIAAQRAQSASDDLSILDDIVVTGNARNAFFAFFNQGKFSSKNAFNTRILTVGLPNGFTQNIREKISVDLLDKNFNKKQVDVVNLCVYKTDVEMQDIIFKPQKFVFELSRFVLKNERDIKPLGIDSTIDRIIRSIPTRDYSVEIQGSSNVLKTADLEKTELFTNPQYSFLTPEQKYELVTNHISSHFLNMYLRLLTGINTSEHSFELLLNDDDRIGDKPTLDQQFMQQLIVSSVTSRLGRPISWEELTRLGFEEAISSKQERLIIRDSKTIADLAKVSSVVSDPSYEARRLLRPKEFERIFHVAVDPDDFEIDILATQKTAQGREALKKLQKQGMVIEIEEFDFATGDRVSQNKRLKVVDRSPIENNFVFEKYFVNFETVLPTVVDSNDPNLIRRDR